MVVGQPRTFTVFDVATDIPGKWLPVLMLDRPGGRCEPLMELVACFHNKMETGMAPQQMRAIAHTVGLFHDFVVKVQGTTEVTTGQLPKLLLKFFVLRSAGTIDLDGSDPYGLWWKPIRYDTYKKDRANLRVFSEYCVKEFGYMPLTPTEAPTVESLKCKTWKTIKKEFNRSERDFLAHLAGHRQEKPEFRPSLSAKPGKVGHQQNMSFIPHDKLERLILATPSIVQRMVFILGAFGGPRISEQLNLWRDDVLPGRFRPNLFPDDVASNVPLVILADPAEGEYLGALAPNGKTRRQHLKERYGLPPRPERKGAVHAGWKGMLMDNEALMISQVYWISPAWAAYYYELYQRLRSEVYPRVPRAVLDSHPYLLINDSPKTPYFGQPLKMNNIKKAWERACDRVGLMPYRGAYHLHGLRGTYARVLRHVPGIQAEHRQRFLHHKSILSQGPYGNDPSVLHDRLKAYAATPVELHGKLKSIPCLAPPSGADP